jgi:hypothetical protein
MIRPDDEEDVVDDAATDAEVEVVVSVLEVELPLFKVE